MWAQLMKFQLKPGKDGNDLATVAAQLQAAEQPGSGLLRTIMMRDQKDPTRLYTLVLFESEEKAREREADPRAGKDSRPSGRRWRTFWPARLSSPT